MTGITTSAMTRPTDKILFIKIFLLIADALFCPRVNVLAWIAINCSFGVKAVAFFVGEGVALCFIQEKE